MKHHTMKLLIAAAMLSTIGTVLAQNPVPQGTPDTSENTQCWDTLNNVARDKTPTPGRLGATGDYPGTVSGSNSENKLQGPGAEPKDETGVTTGQSRMKDKAGTVRPSGVPNC